MTKFRLKGKTKHGKNRVNENGEIWRVHKHQSPLRMGHVLIESLITGNLRWVRTTNDPNFEIEQIL